MKKTIGTTVVALLLALPGAAPAWAQEEQETAPAAGEATPRQTGPEMQRLFYSAEQRRVLEALRQGLVESDFLEDEEFVPVVLREEAFLEGEEEAIVVDRGETALDFGAMVRRRSDGKTFLWINGTRFDVEKDGEFLEKVRNLILRTDQVGAEGVVGIDKFTSRKFKIQVGQFISTDGQIRESLPVIVKHSKN